MNEIFSNSLVNQQVGASVLLCVIDMATFAPITTQNMYILLKRKDETFLVKSRIIECPEE